MSSILRALKKVEEEAMDRENGTGEQKIQMKRLVNREAVASPLIKRLFFIIPALLLLAVAGWLFTNLEWKSDVPGPPPSTSPAPVSSPAKLPSAYSEQKQAPVLKKQVPGEATPAAPEKTVLEKLTSQDTPVSQKELPGEVKPEALQKKRPPVESSVRRVSGLKKEEPKKPAIKTNRPNLTLGGILWSETPGRRQALINGKYLKEGDRIDGVSIVEIAKKSVTLQSGEDKWTIRLH